MFNGTILCIPRSEAARRAGDYLSEMGLHVTQKAAPDVTHLLLPVPSFPNGDEYLAHILADLPDNVIISGGNLSSALLENYSCVDFLQDPYYLAENAAITARCTAKLLQTKRELKNCRILILGWGRIGKCLGFGLRNLGGKVTIAARKYSDLAMIKALGFNSIPITEAGAETMRYDIIVNTVPAMILPQTVCSKDCIALELASSPGMEWEQIINGRGLPNRLAPEESGKLIAETFLRLSI